MLVALVALLVGGWFTFDGSRAFIVGDYVTPKSGAHAGELGPWSKIVLAVGANPRSNLIKALHLALGGLWLLGLVLFFLRPAVGWYVLVASAACSLWHLPLGTIFSLVELCLLWLPQIRSLR